MSRSRWTAAVLALACAAGCSTRYGAQVRGAHVLQAPVVRAQEARPVTRTYRIRVYADEAYRTAAPDWAARIAAQVRRASAVTEGDFGARLELEEIRPWRRTNPTPRLRAALGELAAVDPAREVDWVVGLVGGFFEDGTEDAGGLAPLFGRHFVARAAEAPGAGEAMARNWNALRDDQREALRRGWREHRETVVLLHEWAHTLGAVHECDVKWIMAPTGALLASRFSPGSRALVRAGLAHRDDPARAGWAGAYRAAAAEQEAAAWECSVLADDLARAQRLLDGAVVPARAD